MKNRYLSEKAASRRSIVSEIRKDVFGHAEYRNIQDNGSGNAKLAGDQASAFSGVQRAMDTRRDGISDH